uniref:Hemolin n=1 Tax=Bombyx mori TaxID=7091 RepID=A0A8R2R828_BOMMO|nr:uncharacterized protein LOC101737333 [Bombyx mori]
MLTILRGEIESLNTIIYPIDTDQDMKAQTQTPDNSTVIHTLSLTVTREEIGGKLQCTVSSAALDNPITKKISLNVKVPPNKTFIYGDEEHATHGTLLTLMCTALGARPAATIEWFNGTKKLSPDEHNIHQRQIEMTDTTFKTISNLTIEATRFENGQKFHCEAANEVTIETKDHPMHATRELEIWYPPIVRVEPKNITVIEGSKLLLKCEYESNPSSLSAVFWFRDGERVNVNDTAHYQGGTTDQHSLIIMNARGVDMGNYTCLLTNSVGNGTSEDNIVVNVLYKPQVRLTMSSPSPILETDHKNVTLTCEVVSGNPPTLDEVIWYLDGEVLKHLPDCNGTDGDENLCNEVDPSMLLLQDTTKSFHGNYSCKGKNFAGWGDVSEKTELVVNYPPGPAKLTYSPWRVIKGKSLVLSCSIEEKGRPEANRFKWHRGGRLITDIVSQNWTIDPVTLDNRTNYSCRGVSIGGMGEPATTFVDVLAPPSFQYAMNHYSGALYKSQNISLSCTVECAPPCGVQWLKDGQVISEDNERYYVEETAIAPQANRNDFEATQSVLRWNMSAWPGGALDRAADAASYTCRSSRNLAGPPVNSTTKFAVEYEPENITVTPSIVSVVENEVPAKVVCSARGFPTPSYWWRREDATRSRGKAQRPPLSASGTLLLGAVQRRDAGRYVCEAYNRHGAVSTAVLLDVLYIPECGIQQTNIDGEQVLVCSAKANPAEVSFMWKLKNVNDSLTDEKIWQAGTQSYLRLSPGVDVYRTYLCFANNSVGVSRPCERDVMASKVWWRDQQKLLMIGGIALAALVLTVILCIIIICICRRMRAKSKYNNPVELEERENPDGSCLNENSIAQTIISQALPALSPRLSLSFGPKSSDRTRLVDPQNRRSLELNKFDTNTSKLESTVTETEADDTAPKTEDNKPETSVTPNRWPLKPGVLVHVNSNHTLSPKNQTRVASNNAKTESNLGLLERNANNKTDTPAAKPKRQNVISEIMRNLRIKSDSSDDSGKYKKINKSNKRVMSLALGRSGYAPKNRFKSLFQSDSPNVVVTEGVVSFKRPVKAHKTALPISETPVNRPARKRKKPGDSPPTNGVDNAANGNLGAEHPGLYENLPFHGLQQPPNKPVQAIQPRVVDRAQKAPKDVQTLQKQLTMNPSFAPRVVCPPFVQNALYSIPTNARLQYGVPLISPLPQMYPVHQVLLNPYLPSMQASYLKHNIPTIDEEADRKFSSLNTRASRKPPRFQSMRIVRKRNIERFYPNTEYGENFNEINNNKSGSDNDRDSTEDNLYENCPNSVDLIPQDKYENLTDSIQICEIRCDEMNLSTNTLSRPVPAPRTKISPMTSPVKKDHVYVNLSMPLINTKYTRYFDAIDGPIRASRSAVELSAKDEEGSDQADTDNNDQETDATNDENTKPNIIGATPKRNLSVILPSSSLVKSVVDQLNEQGINKVGLPPRQVITPNKTLQIPKLVEKPVPKRSVVRRSSSVQGNLAMDTDNGQNTNVLQQQYMQKRNHFSNLSAKGKNKKNFQIPLQKHHSFCYFQPIRVDKRTPADRSYNNTIGPLIYQPADPQYYTKTLNRTREKNTHKLNRLKKSESLREKLSCVGLYDPCDRAEHPEPGRGARPRPPGPGHTANSVRNINTDYPGSDATKDEKTKHKKLVYADLALGNHNMKFKNTVNSNRHLYDTYSISSADTNNVTNGGHKHAPSQTRASGQQRSDYATLKFNEIDV